jgi:ceramide glucosyltransferase
VIDTADDDVALVIDSDVELETLDLTRLLAPLRDPDARVAATWCPPVEREPVSLGDRMSAALLGGSLHAFPLLGVLDPAGLVGKTLAVRLDALREVGGFAGLVRHLGEDMELARRLRARGFRIAMSEQVVASLASRRRVTDVLARYARWLLVIRAQRPRLLASYPLLLAATPGIVLGGSLGLWLGLPGAGAAMGLAVVARLVVAYAAARVACRAAGPVAGPMTALGDAVLADALLLGAFVRALGPARVRWRDRSLRLGTHGVLEPG